MIFCRGWLLVGVNGAVSFEDDPHPHAAAEDADMRTHSVVATEVFMLN